MAGSKVFSGLSAGMAGLAALALTGGCGDRSGVRDAGGASPARSAASHPRGKGLADAQPQRRADQPGGQPGGRHGPGRDRRLPPGAAGFSEGVEKSGGAKWGISLDEGHTPLSAWPTGGPVRRVAGNAREGGHKLRFEVVPRPTSFRSEITRPVVPMGADCWYAFSVSVPRSWRHDPGGSILAQWHAKVGRKVDNYPVASLYLVADTWQVRMNWNTRGDTSKGPGWQRRIYRLGPARKAAWTDWVLHARWSHRSDGLLEVWRDGRQVVRHQGPNEYVNKTGPYFKMGIYHPAWRHADAEIPAGTRPLVSYADAIRFACNSRYDAVKPR